MIVNFLLNNKQIALLLAILLLLIPYAIFSAINMRRHTSPQASPATPTVFKTQTTLAPTIYTGPTVSVVITEDPQKRLLNKISQRRPLSSSDSNAKNRILSALNGKASGTIYHTEDINIEYVSAPDLFQVEILSTSIDPAKTQAASWFVSQGMSQQGICDLPLSFYLNFNIANQLGKQNPPFNPLPPGC